MFYIIRYHLQNLCTAQLYYEGSVLIELISVENLIPAISVEALVYVFLGMVSVLYSASIVLLYHGKEHEVPLMF